MIEMKVGWIVLEVLLLGGFLYFGSSVAFVFAMIMVLIPMASLPIHLYMRRKIKLFVSAEHNMRKGQWGDITVILENPMLLPVLRIRVLICAENQLNGEMQTFPVCAWVLPKCRREISTKARSAYCGRIKVRAIKVKLYDCFGLLGIPCKVDEAAYMTVQPDTFEMEILMAPDVSSSHDSYVYSQEKAGSDLTETYQIKEYVPGDNIRRIHWKLSNKFDRPIVRDPALPVIHNVLVFWERSGEQADPDIIDAQAEIIVTLCKSLLENSIQFRVGWNDIARDICIMHEIRDTEEMVGMIPKLLHAAGSTSGVSGAELLLQTGEQALCSHMVYLAQQPGQGVQQLCNYGHVTMILAEDPQAVGGKVFDPLNYKEQLAQIEI